jgi:hypothetical protein
MVHFPEFALTVLYIQTAVIGFPHSEIDGSTDECSSPSHIAAFHVLHRLEVPRHSPYALSSLIIKLTYKQNCLYNSKILWNLLFSIKTIQLSKINVMAFAIKYTSLERKHIISQNLWRWQESNLRPSECKSDALPTELHPQEIGCGDRIWTCDLWVMSPTSYLAAPPRVKLWWAWVDSNYRPHAYQACALTNWATGPNHY